MQNHFGPPPPQTRTEPVENFYKHYERSISSGGDHRKSMTMQGEYNEESLLYIIEYSYIEAMDLFIARDGSDRAKDT